MAQSTQFNLHVLIAVLFAAFFHVGTAIHIEVHPETYNELSTKELSITCSAVGPTYWANTVFTMEIGKKGHSPMAIHTCKELITGPGIKENIKAEGRIDKDAEKSYLRLTITNPGMDDVATYTCLTYYLDESYKMKEEITEKRIKIDHHNVQVIRNLMERMNAFETVVDQQNSIITELNTKLVMQEKELEKQEVYINQLSSHQNTSSSFLAGQLQYSGITISQGQVLKFQNVNHNIGNDYNKDTGVYTAPVDGLYAFNVFALTQNLPEGKVRRQTEISLVANNKIAGVLIADHRDAYDQSSISGSVELKAGQTMLCKVYSLNFPGKTILREYPFTGFSGHLIHAL